jgi:hypothetical protein
MPFKLHPSGFCTYYSLAATKNLITGSACLFCKRVAGHAYNCPAYSLPKHQGSSRGSFFNSCAVLWGKENEKSFVTFTLPSLDDSKTYQRAIDCDQTGDLYITSLFSKLINAWKKKRERLGFDFSYVWVSEAQQERKKKFGGIGDIHYHMVVNQKIKTDDNKVIDSHIIDWLQSHWCSHLKVKHANNCVDVRPLPESIESVPAYVAKYMGKGTQRIIQGRRFAATRDLTAFKPIDLKWLPEGVTEVNRVEGTADNGFEFCYHYFNSREVLEAFGHHMKREGDLSPPVPSSRFEVEIRRIQREQDIARQIEQHYPYLFDQS